MIVVTSCQMKTKTVAYDPETTKAEVNKTLDSIGAAFKSKDANAFLSFLTEDGLFCGTDPSELWDKAEYTKTITKMLASDTTSSSADMKVEQRKIIIDKNGKSAVALRQFMTSWSKPIMLRNTLHLVKIDNRWMVNFSNFAFIPKNDDIPKITAAVSK